ncbi:hypothetical protein D6C99_08611 [Aureobasidium pullulans]|nr:hypothetical protein D6D26_06802 [Aureobasidium pullulans]THY39454.1 hypothetical protein D6C99_08611 [Aureobasidium pullulans]TIA23655.1 hypothetical protein D6C81_02842 [Aureobasidium pullulans]
MAGQSIPTKFPCWCKAVYSWGGETKKDLGFIEGDLIECLNAGDGSWWMGRLRRDRRMVGLFPSNFVQVLDEKFQPAPIRRNVSPPTVAAPQKSKSVFRKPFQGYKEFGYRDDGCNSRGSTPEDRPVKKKFSPYSSMKTAKAPGSDKKPQSSPLKEESTFRVPSPLPRRTPSRASSPVDMYRASSPAPTMLHRSVSPAPSAFYRATSPAPSAMYRTSSPAPSTMYRAASPAPSAMYRPVSPNPQDVYRPSSPNPTAMYSGHASPNAAMYRAASPNPNMNSDLYSRAASPNPNMNSDLYNRAASPNPYRAVSPAPLNQGNSPYRGPSPAASQFHHTPSPSPTPTPMPGVGGYQAYRPQQDYDYFRAASPAPPAPMHHISRQPSPIPQDDASSPPPPAPPPHRILHQQNRPVSPRPSYDSSDHNNGYATPGGHSRDGQSSGMTPSPLRDAMNDVMSSLHDMSSVAGRSSPAPGPESPNGIWSPDAFDLIRSRSAHQARAKSAMDMYRREASPNRLDDVQEDHDSIPSLPPSRDGPPALDEYVSRMETRLRRTKSSGSELQTAGGAVQYDNRPTTSSSQGSTGSVRFSTQVPSPRKSVYDLASRPQQLRRTQTSKTSSSSGTNSTSTASTTSTQITSTSIMSGHSAGAFSATSAGSFARRKWGLTGSVKGRRPLSALSSRSYGDLRGEFGKEERPKTAMQSRPQSPETGISFHSSHATQPAPTPVADWTTNPFETAGVLGGLSAPKAKKSGFFRKMIDTAKTTAKTGAANARSSIASGRPPSRAGSPRKNTIPDGVNSISGGTPTSPSALTSTAHRDMGLGGGDGWMQVRRDVNRSNSLSRNERVERIERCEMMDVLVLNPVEELLERTEGDEGLDGLAITEPTDFVAPSLGLVDKGTRFISALPQMVTPTSLAQSYLCRPYRSDVQRLRAIFTWVAERITWEEDFEGQIDTRRVLQTKRGCSEEIAVLVRDLCSAVGLHAEVVRGYLKGPGERLDLETIARANHFWNAVIIDGEWRIMDCSLANPTNPKRNMYSSANNTVADHWFFLTRPMEICYTHIPLLPEQQHIVPPVPHEVLISLPCACPPYFRHHVELANYDTSVAYLENLEMAHIQLTVPEDVEIVAEVEARAFARDMDGDLFESGDVTRKIALAQPTWIGGRKSYVVKALLPGDEGEGVLKVYAGKRGLMHSIKDNPHALALAISLLHTGQNPPYTFLTRHPTPHAQRHDLYVAQPQCARLVINNTFVFCVRQHPSSLSRFSPDTWGGSSNNASSSSRGRSNSALGLRSTSPAPYARPSSAMSIASSSAGLSHTGSTYSESSSVLTDKQSKPAKLAIQSPSGKIIRFTRKQEYGGSGSGNSSRDEDEGMGSTWETVIKVGERGVYRGLVLADRSARWCVFAEWECV